MRTGQTLEKQIYIPKGRRELIEATKIEKPSALERLKRPIMDENESQSKIARKQTVGTILSNEVPIKMQSVTKPASSRAGSSEIYIPKAKREQMERDAAREAAKKPSMEASSPSSGISISHRDFSNSNRINDAVNVKTDKELVSERKPEEKAKVSDQVPIASLNISSGVLTKAKEVVRGGIYIPKGRRELNEKKQEPATVSALTPPPPVSTPATAAGSLNSNKATARAEQSVIKQSSSSPGQSIPPTGKTYTAWDDSSASEGEVFEDDDEEEYNSGRYNNSQSSSSSSSFPPPPAPVAPALTLEETIERCCLVLAGVPAEMSDFARGNLVRTYLDKGASVRWTSSNECLIMFKVERSAVLAMPGPGCSIFRVLRLKDISNPHKDELVAAARETFTVVKPERDSTVANRLIGAALGIRLPKPQNSSNITANKPRAPSPVREDAWD